MSEYGRKFREAGTKQIDFYNSQYALNVVAVGDGTTTPTGTTYYKYGTVVTIQAIDGGQIFVNWTGSTVEDPNAATTTILVNGNLTVRANFA